MANTEQVEKAEAFYLRACSELLTALDAAIPAWLSLIAATRGYTVASDDPLVTQIHTTMMRDLHEAYHQASPDEATPSESTFIELDAARNPLDILRRGVGPLNERLAAHDLPVPSRDEVQQRLFPDDRYDLAPGAFNDLGDEVHHAGLRWGAAKAHLHLLRHRPQPESATEGSVIAAFVPDLMDQSRLKALGKLVRLRSAEDVAMLAKDPEPDVAVIDVTHDASSRVAQALRSHWPDLVIIGYGPHIDDDALAAAARDCTEVLARSAFFARVQRGTLIG